MSRKMLTMLATIGGVLLGGMLAVLAGQAATWIALGMAIGIGGTLMLSGPRRWRA
jgi:hypothetical protein